MRLVTFRIDNQRNVIVQFPVFVQPYTQRRLVMYQFETVPIPILDRNDQAQSYTQLKINKPYTVLNTETYITLQSQELSTCKKIACEYYCEELFVVKSKSKYSCASTICFNLGPEIKENCEFAFHFKNLMSNPLYLMVDTKLFSKLAQLQKDNKFI